MAEQKLTMRMIEWLAKMENGPISVLLGDGRTLRALRSRGLIERVAPGGYQLTKAGRAALAETPAAPPNEPTRDELIDWLEKSYDMLAACKSSFLSREDMPPRLYAVVHGLNLLLARCQETK